MDCSVEMIFLAEKHSKLWQHAHLKKAYQCPLSWHQVLSRVSLYMACENSQYASLTSLAHPARSRFCLQGASLGASVCCIGIAAVARTCKGPALALICRTDRKCAAGLTPGSTDGENAVATPANATRTNDRESIEACTRLSTPFQQLSGKHSVRNGKLCVFKVFFWSFKIVLKC